MTVNTNNKSMSDEIRFIWLADYQRVMTYNIKKNYHLSSSDKFVVEHAIDDLYQGNLSLDNLISSLKEKIATPGVNIPNMARDIVGYCLLPAADYFISNNNDVNKFLGESAKDEKYVKNLDTFKQALAEEKNGTYDNSKYIYQVEKEIASKIEPTDKDNDIFEVSETDLTDEDKAIRLKIFFENGLGEALNLADTGNSGLLEDVNNELILALANTSTLKKDLSDILLKNKLLIGQENIIIDEKPVPPIGENWLKDFFRIIGSDNFDTLSIAKYIIKSDNAKKLTEEAQTKLRKFLTLYHNINYFPAPFTAIPVESWEIMPGSRHGSSSAPASINKTNSVGTPNLSAPIYKEIKKAAPIKKPEIKVITPAPVVKEEIPAPVKPVVASIKEADNQDIIELKNMLLQYPEGSLERAAIEEEIKTLQNK